ncbi:hypothetical protein PGTUg99_027126 [Puccinia graminis f. sp. tritici]|uniref:Uncharacterized protein n=1 Tax=Puccinia graminis f. sp. tritici TaxID=56615 RepID=A0A5B0PFN6_PUCGR|nr:hypothetical protein PGTUg99_027126 [Puccinia graminis f. sp. tritici]
MLFLLIHEVCLTFLACLWRNLIIFPVPTWMESMGYGVVDLVSSLELSMFVPVGPELFRACHIFGLIIVNTQSFARLSPSTHLRETDVLALFCECAKVSTLYGTHACLSCIGYGPGCEVTHVAGLLKSRGKLSEARQTVDQSKPLFIHSNRYSPGTFPSLRTLDWRPPTSRPLVGVVCRKYLKPKRSEARRTYPLPVTCNLGGIKLTCWNDRTSNQSQARFPPIISAILNHPSHWFPLAGASLDSELVDMNIP